MSDGTPFKHGTSTGYKLRKCRCDKCRGWRREKARSSGENKTAAARAAKLRWSESNPDYHSQYVEANRESILAGQLAWRQSQRESLASKQRKYYQRNLEHCRKIAREYAAANSERAVERARLWASRNAEKARASSRSSSERRRARKRKAEVFEFTQEQIEQRMAYYGNRCYLQMQFCTGGFDEIDHVKPLSKDGAHALCNLKPACQSCNRRKSDKWPFKFQ
jgi:5-methylcytosine-specific restriction endonuclease McrA